jgi:decaprenylphospho-beta-D-ribofuranose 2-oxidase
MDFTHIDLIGLNKHIMHDAPIAGDNAGLKTLAESSNHSLSIAGMRHSQGGHTALDDGRMVFTEAMEQSIKVSDDKKTVTINAGATWSDLHFVLGPMGLAPLVHQSSPHFSIGGSLSVDCHGREVHEGALSNTVESITVLTNKGNKLEETTASRTDKSDLFFGALGGYGACGVILKATIRITQNKFMYKVGTHVTSLEKLKRYLDAASTEKSISFPPEDIYMFYAWLDVSHIKENYLTQAMVYEYKPQYKPELGMRISHFKNENWASTEAMRAAWVAARRDSGLRDKLFKIISDETTGSNNGSSHLINFLREEISFTSTKGDATDVDLLQEFFIPLSNIVAFLNQLQILLPIGNATIEVLSCTLRIIQPPHEERGKPFLSYAHRDAPFATPMVSVALEIKVNKKMADADKNSMHPIFKVDENALDLIRKIINEAQRLEGSYYLPYYQAAKIDQFQAAYPHHTKWKKAADDWNPEVDGRRAFNNEFLKAHLK